MSAVGNDYLDLMQDAYELNKEEFCQKHGKELIFIYEECNEQFQQEFNDWTTKNYADIDG